VKKLAHHSEVSSWKLVAISLFLLFFVFVFSKNAEATLSACSATVDLSSVNISSASTFNFSIANDDSSNGRMVWVQITRPSANFTITDFTSFGLTTSLSASIFTVSGFDAGVGSAFGQGLSVTAGGSAASSTNWTVQASDNTGGTNPTTCTGSLGTSIVDPANSVAPVISSLTISAVTASSVTISWTTDKSATSVINYGTTSGYGSTKSDTTLATSHSLTLDSLSTNTSYHYQVTSVDGFGNTVSTSDNTFATASTVSTTTTTTSVVVVTQAPSAKAVSDTTSPTIYIDTNFDKPFREVPKISGRASDNKAVSKIEYSLDTGRNWQPADNANLGRASTVFDFTPPSLDDDNYKVKVRVTDSSGNTGISKTYTMVIDRLSPDVGQSFFSLGPQPLFPNKDGIIFGLEGMDQKITLSAVGGPTTIDLTSGNQMFSLVKNLDNGLWSGILSFENPGIFPLVANSIDGAGNTSKRNLNSIIILPKGSVSYAGKKITGAKVTIYFLDPLTKNFVLWDGASYGQKNPQKTDKDGKYALFMPPGKYYLEIKASGFRTLKTDIFTVAQSIPINNNFVLEKEKGLTFGPITIPFFDFSETHEAITLSYPFVPGSLKQSQAVVIGKEIPDVELKDAKNSVPTSSLRGKRTLITILSSWDPLSSSQLNILNSLKITDISLVTIFPQETASKISIYKKRGRYNISMLADSDGELIKPLNIQVLPLHILLSRKGVVEKVRYGVLTKDEIEDNLIN
jgi:hypothetical protein